MKTTFDKHYVESVTGIGPVAVSRHAQVQAGIHGISEEQFHEVLQQGKDTPDSSGATLREKDHVRLVIIKPDPFRGAMLVKTCYRVAPQARTRC